MKKKIAAKKPAKKATSEKKSEKSAPASKETLQAAPADGAPVVDQDELEEMEDAAMAAKSPASADPGLEAAAGAATATGSLKNFRHHPDMENFYRFIYENDLRYEALEIIDGILTEKMIRKNVKVAKTKAH